MSFFNLKKGYKCINYIINGHVVVVHIYGGQCIFQYMCNDQIRVIDVFIILDIHHFCVLGSFALFTTT